MRAWYARPKLALLTLLSLLPLLGIAASHKEQHSDSSTQQEHADATKDTTRYVIMDSTQDSPSVTSLLIALEAASTSANATRDKAHTHLVGLISTEADEVDTFEQLLQGTGLAQCVDLVSVPELELYPAEYPPASIEDAPATVRYLVEKSKLYPGKIVIYCTGSLAAVALAQMVDPDFGKRVAELVIVANNDVEYPGGDWQGAGTAFLSGDSPFLRDPDAFLEILAGEIPLLRVIAPEEHITSTWDLAERVTEQVKRETGLSEDPHEYTPLSKRPLAQLYVHGHRSRMLQGYKSARLLSEPGAAAVFDPDIITDERDVGFLSQDVTQDPSKPEVQIVLQRLDDKDITPGDRSTRIASIDVKRLHDTIVRVRSRDWSGFCEDRHAAAQRAGTETDPEVAGGHDEL